MPRLERANLAAGTAEQQGVLDQVQEISDPVATSATNTEAPPNTTKS
jgi:hypothetical protein